MTTIKTTIKMVMVQLMSIYNTFNEKSINNELKLLSLMDWDIGFCLFINADFLPLACPNRPGTVRLLKRRYHP
jgi:hypothetical protein